ncbi:MAG TPA: signal peptidase I [Acidimicrobiales bacterium]|nr:signal peptidase I [Acidimicrobiales bacterium]
MSEPDDYRHGPAAALPDPGAPAPAVSPAGEAPPRSWWRGPAEWVLVIVAALAAAFLVKTFVLQTFFIPSASMEPTLMIGDRVFVNKLAYNFHPVHRGDIVVFTLPPGESAGPNIDDLIKRVIGLPGDTIEAIGGRVYINGKVLNEPYLPRGTVTTLLPKQVVPKGRYFLLGDNRTDSKDSRFFGAIDEKLLVGRAFVRVWPLSRLGLL